MSTVRRLAVIVAADAVGYSRLLAQDEAATLAALDHVRTRLVEPALAKSNGTIVRLLGDSTLIAFGSVPEAVEFAVALQRGMTSRNREAETAPPLQYRVGVHLGDVVASGGELHGEGINVAVRLEALAPAGGVCISQAVYEQVAGDLAREFEPLGVRHLKNISVPVAVWRWQTDASPTNIHLPLLREMNGQQFLDPKVTRLLVELHMRSARLALSDAVDSILTGPDAGRGLDFGELYSRLGANLNLARAMLDTVKVQCVDNISEISNGKWQPVMSMGAFIAGVFDSADTSYAMRLIPQIKAILDSTSDAHNKRTQLMGIFNTFMNDEMVPRTMSLMKCAFAEV